MGRSVAAARSLVETLLHIAPVTANVGVWFHGRLNKGERAMHATDEPGGKHTPWYVKVLMAVGWFVLWPVGLFVFLLMLALCACAVVYNYVSEFVFRARMRQCGRYLPRRELRSRIAVEGAGTLIIEGPSLGWNLTHAWWTPDNVLAICPFTMPSNEDYREAAKNMQCLEWDRWHWNNYTDPDNGKAFLLRVWNGRSLERWVTKAFPDTTVVHTWTALVHVRVPAAHPGQA